MENSSISNSSKLNNDSDNSSEKTRDFTALSKDDLLILKEIELQSTRISFLFKQFFIVLLFDFLIGSAVGLWFFVYIKQRMFIHIVILVVVIMLLLIFTMFSSVLALIRLIMIRKSLITKIIIKFTNNFVVANFWTASKFMISEICLIKNSREIFYNGGLYIVNPACAWLDKKKRPNLFYFEGIPNPIDLHFETNINKFTSASIAELPNLKDSYGNPLDIAFDSVSVKSFKNDESLKNIMKEKGESSNLLIIIMVILGIIIVAVLIYIAIKTGQKTPVPITVTPSGSA